MQIFRGARSALMERHPQRVELGCIPPDADDSPLIRVSQLSTADTLHRSGHSHSDDGGDVIPSVLESALQRQRQL